MQRKNMWKEYTEDQQKELEELSVRYKECLDIGKTERECVKLGKKMADTWGYQNLEECISKGITLKAGDKVYADCMGKAFVMFQLGKKPLEEGMNILGAHIDSPRIDVKQNPLYEDSDMAYLDTHYYGGIKKYQWVTIPLAIHGTIAKKDGTVRDIIIGEKEDDPVLVISDLLIHLSQQQIEKKAGVVVEGEGLDILVATKPLTGAAEVEIDKETGPIELLQFAAAVDCGTPLNENLARVQTEGGLAQGIGMAMYEDVTYSDHGRVHENSFMQYKVPSRLDIGKVQVEFECSYEPTGPFGAKSIGEIVINTPSPAIANAVYNAVGVRIRELPITDEKIFIGIMGGR